MKSLLAAAACLALFACTEKKPATANAGAPAAPGAPGAVGGVGERLAEANAADLRVTKDGKFAAYLADGEKPRLNGVPPYLRVGELFVVGTAPGSAPRRLGSGGTNAPGGLVFTADSQFVLFLAGYGAADQAGELKVARLSDGQPASRLGGRVSYFTPSRDGHTVAFVDEGALKVGELPDGPFKEVATEVTTAEFAADGTLYFRRRMALGGGLYQVKSTGTPTRVADQVGDLKLSKDGRVLVFGARSAPGVPSYDLFVAEAASLKPKKLASQVIAFALGKADSLVAYTSGPSPESPGELFVVPVAGGAATSLGTGVPEFKFSPDDLAIAWRGHVAGDDGELAVAMLDGLKATKLSKRCRSYGWSPDGKRLAFTVRQPDKQFVMSIDLHLFTLGAEKAEPVKTWAYEYAFTPDGQKLLFRADCVREGRACNVFTLDLAAKDAKPVSIAEGVFGFKLPEKGARVLLTYARSEYPDLYDVAVLNLGSGERKTLDQLARLPIFFLDQEGGRVGYTLAAKGRGAGVYVATAVP